MRTSPLHIAVFGLGRMGRIYAETVASLAPRACLHALVDPELEDKADLLDRLSAPHVLRDPHEALALPNLDAVVIATPTDTHAALATAAARAGKAVFCEKPLALTLSDSRATLEAAREANVMLQPGLMRRFDAGYAEAKRLIDEGTVGEPILFKSVGRDPFCPRPAFADPSRSGGLILDMAIHDFDLARWLMGREVEAVSAMGALLVCDDLRAVGDIDNAVVNLRFEGGALGQVEVSRNAFYGYDIRTEVLGSEGALRIGYDRQTPLLLLTRDGARHDTVPYLMERFGTAYRAQIGAFVECARRGTPPPVDAADAHAAFEIGLAATYAAATGGEVALEAVRGEWQP